MARPCGSCDAEVAAEFKFCPHCGTKLPARCPSCGFACPPDFAFCPQCGTKLGAALSGPEAAPVATPARPPEPLRAASPVQPSEATPDSERRPVTVLFADLSGFTTLSESRDPEEIAALTDRCLRTMADVVYGYEGTVDKYMGDCVMALFGAPVAHEDDPERALRAALDMRQRIAAVNAEIEHDTGHPAAEPLLSLHIGVNTGTVLAGAVGADQRRDYTVLGDAVNVASRLESAASQGQIVVGPGTYRLTRSHFAYEPLGHLALKGKTDLLEAYRLLELRAAPLGGRGLESYGLAAPLVGRDAELAQLLDAFAGVEAGRAQMVSLVGEAGNGKSRLLRDFVARLDQRTEHRTGARAIIQRAACSPLGEQTYGVLASLFRNAYDLASDDADASVRHKIQAQLGALGVVPEEVERTVPLVMYALGHGLDPALRHLEPEQLRRQLFLAVHNILATRVVETPTILIAEDLQWADAASLELLHFLVNRLAGRQFMLLATYRPGFHPFNAEPADGVDVPHRRLELGPLSEEDSRRLFDTLFGPAARIPAAVREIVVQRAGGNPYYLEELVRNLIEAGILVQDAQGWHSTADSAALQVPATLQGLLLARLDRLPAGPHRLAQELAVLGPTIDSRLIAPISSEPEVAASQVSQLCAAGILEQGSEPGAQTGGLRFASVLLQETAYQSLLVRRRTVLHGLAGECLQALCGPEPEELGDLQALGYHFSLGPNPRQGAHYLLAAGDRARTIYANEDAARTYARALQVLERLKEPADQQRLEVLERLADVQALTGRRDEALAHLATVLEAAIAERDAIGQARVRRKIGALRWEGGERDAALAELRRGLAALDGQPTHLELAHLYQELGRLAFRSGENQQAVEWGEQALALARNLQAAGGHDDTELAAVITHAENTVGVALARLERLSEAVARIERAVAVALEHDQLQVACRAYTNLGVLYSSLDPGKAIETSLAGLELAKKISHLGFQSWLYANLAGAYCTFTGQCEEEGIAAAKEAIDLDRQLGQVDHLAVPLVVLGQIYQCHGSPAEAMRCYQEALELAEAIHEPQLLFPCYDGLATLYLEMDDEARAEDYLLKGQQLCEEAGIQPESLMVLPFLC